MTAGTFAPAMRLEATAAKSVRVCGKTGIIRSIFTLAAKIREAKTKEQRNSFLSVTFAGIPMQSVLMPQIETSETASTAKHWIRIGLAIWMLIGGLQGLWIMRGGQAILFASASMFFTLGFYILFFAGNVVAAWMLWKTPRGGLRLTFGLQILALIRFQGPQVKHVLASLYGAWLTQTENGFVFLRNAGSCFAFAAESSFGTAGTRSVFDGPIYFGVNLVAIAIGVLAWVLLEATRQNQEEPITE